MISDLLRQVGHVILLMVLIWGWASSWPCTSISASAWRAVLRAEREETMTPDQLAALHCIAEAAVSAERETG